MHFITDCFKGIDMQDGKMIFKEHIILRALCVCLFLKYNFSEKSML